VPIPNSKTSKMLVLQELHLFVALILATGKMPVPQELHFFCCIDFSNRQDACSTIKFTFCGTGILPVKRE
jgi:hypothetical protein